ncbi:uncharacterized protein J8A68_000769 [[Candida] subhashii]|uniref:Brl1/Brr6 domain-containing protein n=1 Tax=[Candida] subhashii TaxID=561895 RepID=A0A8J5V564_9ASCO|nr:uncharacterized protein J8A68_000769 [[Candida] subhashii]KAG7665749.1 hypothetical protein J8A68_000769 [[Candida] subhashii]
MPFNQKDNNQKHEELRLLPPVEISRQTTNEESIIEQSHPESESTKDETGEIDNPVNCEFPSSSSNQIVHSEKSGSIPRQSFKNNDAQIHNGYSILFDPMIPYTLALYLQLLVNIIIVSIILYLIYIFMKTIQSDINHKLELHTMEAIHEISQCSTQYIRNRCNQQERVPAIEKECLILEKCQNRDPGQLAKSKITAETFAEIINGFLNGISWKSLLLTNGLIWGGLVVSNVVFGNYRSSSVNVVEVSSVERKLKVLEDRIRQQEEVIRRYELLEKEESKDLIDSSPVRGVSGYRRL